MVLIESKKGQHISPDEAARAVGQSPRQFARLLDLAPARLPMHSSFDRVADYLAGFAVLAGTLQKIAGDII